VIYNKELMWSFGLTWVWKSVKQSVYKTVASASGAEAKDSRADIKESQR
jgi:hypothetical protein